MADDFKYPIIRKVVISNRTPRRMLGDIYRNIKTLSFQYNSSLELGAPHVRREITYDDGGLINIQRLGNINVIYADFPPQVSEGSVSAADILVFFTNDLQTESYIALLNINESVVNVVSIRNASSFPTNGATLNCSYQRKTMSKKISHQGKDYNYVILPVSLVKHNKETGVWEDSKNFWSGHEDGGSGGTETLLGFVAYLYDPLTSEFFILPAEAQPYCIPYCADQGYSVGEATAAVVNFSEDYIFANRVGTRTVYALAIETDGNGDRSVEIKYTGEIPSSVDGFSVSASNIFFVDDSGNFYYKIHETFTAASQTDESLWFPHSWKNWHEVVGLWQPTYIANGVGIPISAFNPPGTYYDYAYNYDDPVVVESSQRRKLAGTRVDATNVITGVSSTIIDTDFDMSINHGWLNFEHINWWTEDVYTPFYVWVYEWGYWVPPYSEPWGEFVHGPLVEAWVGDEVVCTAFTATDGCDDYNFPERITSSGLGDYIIKSTENKFEITLIPITYDSDCTGLFCHSVDAMGEIISGVAIGSIGFRNCSNGAPGYHKIDSAYPNTDTITIDYPSDYGACEYKNEYNEESSYLYTFSDPGVLSSSKSGELTISDVGPFYDGDIKFTDSRCTRKTGINKFPWHEDETAMFGYLYSGSQHGTFSSSGGVKTGDVEPYNMSDCAYLKTFRATHAEVTSGLTAYKTPHETFTEGYANIMSGLAHSHSEEDTLIQGMGTKTASLTRLIYINGVRVEQTIAARLGINSGNINGIIQLRNITAKMR